MPNVMFKRGLQANLPANGSALDGSFYLTTDTNRLYVGNGTNLVELNKSITVVNTANDLPTSGVEVGQFYYIKGSSGTPGTDENGNPRTRVGNILAVVTSVDAGGTNPTWVQVNPDTVDGNDNDWVSGFSIARDSAAEALNPGSLIYSWTISQKDVDGNVINDSAHALSGSFSIPISDIVSSGVSVGLTESLSSGNLVIGTTGNGSDSNGSITITAGDNIEFDNTGNTYSISAVDSTYELAGNASTKTISLKEDGATSTGSIIFAEGNAIDITVAPNSSDSTVTITHENVTRGADTVSDADPGFGGDLTVVTGVTTNSQGHVTQVATRKLILPDEPQFSITAVGADNTGKVNVTYSDGTTSHTVSSSQADIFFTYGAAGGANNPSVTNQGNLPVYTRDEIDAKIRELDGMTYKGAISSNAALPTSNVKNGDTYKINSSSVTVPTGNGSYSGEDAKIGDLLIAHGTEGSDGYITSATLAWDYIPSGDEIDTLYKITAANNSITLAPEDINNSATSYSVGIAGGNVISASTANNVITLDHDTVTTSGAMAAAATAPAATSTLDFGDTFNAIVGVKADGYGHITNVYTQALTLPDEPDQVAYTVVDTASTASTHGDGKIAFKADNSTIGEITFQNGDDTTAVVTRNVSEGKAIVKVNHNTLTPTYTNHTTSGNEEAIDPTSGANVITALSFDSYGHVSGYTATKLVLPDDALVTLNGSVTAGTGNDANKKATIAMDLVDANSGHRNGTSTSIPSYSISSSSLKIATTAATSSTPANIAIDIEWGTF